MEVAGRQANWALHQGKTKRGTPGSQLGTGAGAAGRKSSESFPIWYFPFPLLCWLHGWIDDGCAGKLGKIR